MGAKTRKAKRFLDDTALSFIDRLPGVPPRTDDQKKFAKADEYEALRAEAEAAYYGLIALGADTTTLEAMLGEAETAADADTLAGYDTALKKLDTFEKLVTKAEKALGKDVSAEKKNAAFEVRYLQKLNRLEDGIAELQELPGTAKDIEAVRTAIANGKIEADKKSFEAAYKALGTFDVSALIGKKKGGFTDFLKDSKERSDKAVDDLPKAFATSYSNVLIQYEAFAEYATDGEAGIELAKINAAVDIVVTAKGKEPIKAAAATQGGILDKLTKTLETNAANRKKLAENYEAAKKEVDQGYETLVKVLDANDTVAVDKARRAAAKKAVDRDYVEAEKLASALLVTINEKNKAALALKKTWDDGAAGRKALREKCEQLKGCPVTAQQGEAIRTELDDIVQQVGDFRVYLRGTDRVTALTEKADKLLKTALKNYTSKKMTDARDRGDKFVEGPFDALAKEFETLEKKLGGPPPEALVARLTALQTQWEKDRNGAASQKALRQLRTKAVENANALRAELQKANTDEGELEKVKAEKATEEARAEYETERADAKRALDQIAPTGVAQYRLMLKNYQEADAAAPKDYAAATKVMAGVFDEASKLLLPAPGTGTKDVPAQSKIEKQIAYTAKQVQQKIAALKERIDRLAKKGGRAFKAYFAEFRTQHGDLAAMAKALNEGVLEECLQSAAEIDAQLDMAEKALGDGKDANQFKAVLVKISDLRDALDAPDLKRVRSRRSELVKELNDASAAVKGMDPAAGLRHLKPLETSIEQAGTASRAAKLKRAKFKEELKVVTDALDKSPVATEAGGKKTFPELYAQYKGKIATAVRQAKTEGEEDDALNGLAAVKSEIAKLKPNDLKPLAEKNKEIVDAKKQGELDKERFAAEIKNYARDVVGPAKEAISNHEDGDPSQLDELKSLKAQAKAAAKAGNFTQAAEHLAKAKLTSQQIVDNPQGFKKNVRDDMPKLKSAWSDAVNGFNAAAEELANEVAGWTPNEPNEAIPQGELTAAAAEVRELKQLFTGSEFDGPIDKITANGATPQARKAAREEALRQVRRAREILERDKVLAAALANPFGVGMIGPSRRMLSTVYNIELSASTGV